MMFCRVAPIACLLVVASIATAEPSPDSEPEGECKPAGRPLFEVDQGVDFLRVRATTKLYRNGARTTEVMDFNGKVARTEAGCLSTSQLDSIQEDLRSASGRSLGSGGCVRSR
jgi:hypothetical protein